MRVSRVLVSLCVVLATAPPAAGQVALVTGTTGSVLRFPQNARSIALGGIGVADPSAAVTSYFNPARVFDAESFGASYYHNDGIDAIVDLEYDGGEAWGANRVTRDGVTYQFGYGLRYFRMHQELEADYTVFLPEGVGRAFAMDDWYLAMTAAGGVVLDWMEVGAGVSVKPVSMEFGGEKETYWTYDLGVFQRSAYETAGIRVVQTLGMSYLNVARKAEVLGVSAWLPRQLRVGGGFRFELPSEHSAREDGSAFALTVLMEYLFERWASEIHGGAVGIEMSFFDIVDLRAGVPDASIASAQGHQTYGAGIGWFVGGYWLRADISTQKTEFYLDSGNETAFSVSVARFR